MPNERKYLDESGLAHYDGTVEERFNPLNAYPVGSIYMSVNSTSPATLFGGTWERITGRFLLSATDNGSSGASQAAGNTGGAATVTLTSAQSGVPAHVHGLNSHKHSIGAHAHGLNSHTHTYSKSNTPTSGTSITTANLPKHSHTFKHGSLKGTNYGAQAGNANWAEHFWMSTGLGAETTVTTSETGSGTAHSHTITYTSTSSGQASGSTANSTAFDSGASSGDTASNTASNASEAHENMPPYLAVYVWKRTA